MKHSCQDQNFEGFSKPKPSVPLDFESVDDGIDVVLSTKIEIRRIIHLIDLARNTRANESLSLKVLHKLYVFTYTIRNLDSEPKTVFIEHPIREGWKLAGKLKATETTPPTTR